MAEIFDKTSSTWTEGTPDGDADFIAYADTSEGVMKRTTPQAMIESAVTALDIANRQYAVEFDGSEQHVNHGLFWQPATAYADFFAEFLIKPQGGQYFISAGYGGNHCLLFGVAGDEDGYTLTGNIYSSDTATTTSFSTTDEIRHDEWAHVAVGYDNTRIVIFINGVQASLVTYAGNRKTALDVDGTLLIGGSNHQNFIGLVGAFRIFEGDIPFPSLIDNTIRPAVETIGRESVYVSGTGMLNASIAVDYRTGSLADNSSGLSGAKHGGVFAEASGGMTGEAGQYETPAIYLRDSTLLPAWSVDAFEYSNTAAAQKTQIATTRIYDDFSRADVHYGNSTALGLGTTRVGAKTWSAAAWGILNGLAYCSQATFSSAIFALITDAGNPDGTIIWRRPVASMPTGTNYSFLFRYVDANNHLKLYVDEFGQGNVYEVVAGVATLLGLSFSFGTSWTEAKVVLSGTSVTVWNGASLGTRTMGNHLTATTKGMALVGTMLRISEFGVI